jgi:receptor protein-tyrosine kinase
MLEEQSSDGRVDLRTALQVLRRRIAIVVLCLVVLPGVALAAAMLSETQYTATATLLLRDPQLDQKLFGTSFVAPSANDAREVATNLKLVSLDVVAARTAKAMGPGFTAGDVSKAIETPADQQANVVSVIATYPEPKVAAKLANTFARQYIQFRRGADRAKITEARELVQRQLDELPSTQSNGSNARSLRQRLQELEILTTLQTGNAELVEVAAAPTSPSAPQPRRSVLLALIVALFLGIALAFLVERLDRRLRDPERVKEIFGRPVLTAIPASEELSETAGPLPAHMAEPFRMLRANLRYFNVSQEAQSVLVTSAQPGDGKSTVAWNLAWAGGSAGKRTLLIEADLRRPSLARWAHETTPGGLSGLLSGQTQLEDIVETLTSGDASGTRIQTIDVLFAGPLPPNPDELIDSKRMRELIATAERTYDLVVIDTPPTSVVSDAIPLVKEVSGVLVVARLGRTNKDAAARLASQLENLDARVLGVVVNGVKVRRGSGYEYGYGYGYGSEAPAAARANGGGNPDDVPLAEEAPQDVVRR